MRITTSVIKKRKRILRRAKGYRGAKGTLYRVAREAVMKSGQYAYIGRRLRKRDFRKLWIARINAGARANGLSYSRMMDGLKKANIDINRKILSEIAIADPKAFADLAGKAKGALSV